MSWMLLPPRPPSARSRPSGENASASTCPPPKVRTGSPSPLDVLARGTGLLMVRARPPARSSPQNLVPYSQRRQPMSRPQRHGTTGVRWRHVPLDVQLSTFQVLLRVAANLRSPVGIHSYTATQLVPDELHRTSVLAPILHWWTGTAAETREAVTLDCYFSSTPRWLVGRVPHRRPPERILVESHHGWGAARRAVAGRTGGTMRQGSSCYASGRSWRPTTSRSSPPWARRRCAPSPGRPVPDRRRDRGGELPSATGAPAPRPHRGPVPGPPHRLRRARRGSLRAQPGRGERPCRGQPDGSVHHRGELGAVAGRGVRPVAPGEVTTGPGSP
ncbi:MAG TPA: hypothetical protein ENN53_05320 [Candidatus Acetothermia bacterium]|nr:hypothetical protein [Candidatus Acetothermia bacterium]